MLISGVIFLLPQGVQTFTAGMVLLQNLTEIDLTSAPKKALTFPVTSNSSVGLLMREVISDVRILPSPPCFGWKFSDIYQVNADFSFNSAFDISLCNSHIQPSTDCNASIKCKFVNIWSSAVSIQAIAHIKSIQNFASRNPQQN